MCLLFLRNFLISLLAVGSFGAHAVPLDLPKSVFRELLSDTVPFVFSPVDLRATDFEIIPVDAVSKHALDGGDWSLSIESDSFQWVRVEQVIVLPRVRVEVRNVSGAAFNLEVQGFHQVSSRADDSSPSIAQSLYPAIDHPNNILMVRAASSSAANALTELRFRLRLKQSSSRSFIAHDDNSCSRNGIEVRRVSSGDGEPTAWVSFGCRMVYSSGSPSDFPSFELFSFWNGLQGRQKINNIESIETSDGIWVMRLQQSPGVVYFENELGRFEVKYRIPARLPWVSVGFGIGPYLYNYEVPNSLENTNTVTALGTGYASFFLHESMRIVSFQAFPIHSKFSADVGVYLLWEQTRAIDDRFSMSVLLGGHSVLFLADGELNAGFSGPQGVEVTIRDFLLRSYNLNLGGFFYPLIENRSYVNTWIRWGNAKYFGEINYIKWNEPYRGSSVFSESVGLSFGFPVARFL